MVSESQALKGHLCSAKTSGRHLASKAVHLVDFRQRKVKVRSTHLRKQLKLISLFVQQTSGISEA